MPDESAQASMGRSWNRVALFATGGALLLMVLALVNHSTAPLPPPRKLSLEAYTAFLSDYIQEFRKLLLVLARKAAELEQRGVQASKAAASLEAEHRSLGNALNERLLLKHRTSLRISQDQASTTSKQVVLVQAVLVLHLSSQFCCQILTASGHPATFFISSAFRFHPRRARRGA